MTHATAKHTPTPWKNESGVIYGEGGRLICDTLKVLGRNNEGAPYEANAQHIVKCVNCHDELVEACKKALEIFHDYETGNHGGLTVSPNCLTLQQHQADYVYDIEQALAKAEEE